MKHHHLNEQNNIDRLVSEYNQHKSLVVAYDYDNTVFDYHSKGHDYSEVIQLLDEAKSIGCYLIVFTAADDLNRVKDYLLTEQIPFDAINENPPFFKNRSRKIYYNILLDDRAGLLSAYNELKQTINIIKNQTP